MNNWERVLTVLLRWA